MSLDPKCVAARLLLLALPVLLTSGCEVEGSGGSDRARWHFTSNPRDPDDRPNPDVEIVYVGDRTAVSVRP